MKVLVGVFPDVVIAKQSLNFVIVAACLRLVLVGYGMWLVVRQLFWSLVNLCKNGLQQ